MSDATFQENLLKSISASVYFLVGLVAAREMFSKSYFSLGAAEKIAVDQAVLGHIAGNFQALTPEMLQSQTKQVPVGFQAPPPAKPAK